MERSSSRKKAETLSQALKRIHKLKPTKNSGELLSISEDNSATDDHNHHRHNHLCGITWPLVVCGPELDDVVPWSKSASVSSLDSYNVVDELLPVVKSEQQLKVVGRKRAEGLIVSRLLLRRGKIQLSVVPIVGTSGIGKTTVARLVYDNEAVKKHFEVRAWVTVAAQELKQLKDVARELIKAATGMSCPLTSIQELDEMVRDSFLSQRSLIVLDGVESISIDSWRHMRSFWFNVLGVGSKVIITSCDKKVAETVKSKPFELKELSQDASWSLYSSFAFGYSKSIKDSGLIPTARRLAARCKGVPLSLKLLGSLMRFEESLIEILSSGGLMERIPPFLHIKVVLHLSVLALSQDLLNCFAFCAAFPFGHVLEREKLIKMWIAEGLITPSMGMRTPEDIADSYFQQLLCRGFFTDITCDEYGDVMHVRMPAVIHKFAQKTATRIHRDKVAYVVDFADQHDSDWLSLTTPFGEQYSPRYLRMLIAPSIKTSGVKENRSIVELKGLLSLDLSSSGIRELPHHISALKKLRYLNLSHTLIRRLPKSIARLVRLQTLDLSGCYYLQHLPKKISNLEQLRHLDLSECNSLSFLPSGIGYLSSLQTLPLFVLGQPNKMVAGLGELKKLNNLRGELCIRNLENVKDVGQAQTADLKQKKLHYLGLSWSHSVDECVDILECLQPNPEIRVLELEGYGAHGFPSWIPKLTALVKLSLKDCRFQKLPTLGKLPLLEELLLEGLVNIKSIGPEFHSSGQSNLFPSLVKLKLCDMPELQRWSTSTTPRAFPKLKTLSIQGCPQLQNLPSLPSVEELVVWSSHSKILRFLTRIKSLSSLLINDMEVGDSFAVLKPSSRVKKLVVVNCRNLDPLTYNNMEKFTALAHLRILHCLNIETLRLSRPQCLQKLNIVDCQDLSSIELVTEKFTLMELVIEDCSKLESVAEITSLNDSLRKLIVRNCPQFIISPQELRKLQKLEFLFISGCPQLEEQLEKEKSEISHVSCVIVGDRQSSK